MKDNKIYLIHIRDCLTRIKTYTQGGKKVFFEQIIIQDIVN